MPTPVPLTHPQMLEAVRELCVRDTDLYRVVERHGPPPLWARRPGFATLVRIVLEQQVSLASARAAFGRLQRGAGQVTALRLSQLSLAEMQALGITRQKAVYIREIAGSIMSGALVLPTHVQTENAREILLGLRGVGPWTADIYQIMALRHPDIWPDGDLALVTAMKQLKRLRSLPAPERARRIALSWQPWRAVAARILWHHYLSASR